MALAMAPETTDLKTWLMNRLRGTNWAAAGLSAAFQVAVLIMLVTMGIVSVTPEPKRERLTVTTIATSPEQQPAPPAQPKPQPQDKPVVQPRADTVMPPTKLQISAAPPVAAAAERAPDPPTPAPAPAAPAAAAPAAAPAPAGPVRVANIGASLSCPTPSYPAKANFERQEGTVVIRVVLSAEGRITSSSLRRSSGFRLLDDAALSAVSKCRGTRRPTDVTGDVAVPFTLRKS
ncbi:MAG: TonB family protein [Novosphingobium sp.]